MVLRPAERHLTGGEHSLSQHRRIAFSEHGDGGAFSTRTPGTTNAVNVPTASGK